MEAELFQLPSCVIFKSYGLQSVYRKIHLRNYTPCDWPWRRLFYKTPFCWGFCSTFLRVMFLLSSQQNFRAQLLKPQHLSFREQKECLGKLQRIFQTLHFMKHSHLPVSNTNAFIPHKKLTPKKDMVLWAGAHRRNLTLRGPIFFFWLNALNPWHLAAPNSAFTSYTHLRYSHFAWIPISPCENIMMPALKRCCEIKLDIT